MSQIAWSGKPLLEKTVVKFILIFIVLTLLLSPVFYLFGTLNIRYGLVAFAMWLLFASIFFVVYYYNKRAFVFYITDKSVRIEKSWVFGTYQREITLDQIKDVHISQGILARFFNCGSLLFVSTAGLEVGYAHAGAGVGTGAGGILVGGGTGTTIPQLLKGKGNTFWDIPNPSSVRQILVNKLMEWREVAQQQRMAVSLEKMMEKMPSLQQPAPSTSLVSELERLNALLEKGAITKAEYEKIKEKLLKNEK
ncbi:MAG: PH domain-containing protein [Candidatus Bathyarchaeia archaeon]